MKSIPLSLLNASNTMLKSFLRHGELTEMAPQGNDGPVPTDDFSILVTVAIPRVVSCLVTYLVVNCTVNESCPNPPAMRTDPCSRFIGVSPLTLLPDIPVPFRKHQ